MVVGQDRNGREIKIGDAVRIQHCVARYGETQVDEGELLSVDKYGGVTLKLSRATRLTVRSSVGFMEVRRYAVGESFYIPNGLRSGRFEDFEHGHDFWVEVKP